MDQNDIERIMKGSRIRRVKFLLQPLGALRLQDTPTMISELTYQPLATIVYPCLSNLGKRRRGLEKEGGRRVESTTIALEFDGHGGSFDAR